MTFEPYVERVFMSNFFHVHYAVTWEGFYRAHERFLRMIDRNHDYFPDDVRRAIAWLITYTEDAEFVEEFIFDEMIRKWGAVEADRIYQAGRDCVDASRLFEDVQVVMQPTLVAIDYAIAAINCFCHVTGIMMEHIDEMSDVFDTIIDRAQMLHEEMSETDFFPETVIPEWDENLINQQLMDRMAAPVA